MGGKYRILRQGEPFKLGRQNKVEHCACCDCGLVHIYQYTAHKDGSITRWAWRHQRATGQKRRWMKKRKEGIWEAE